MSNGGNNPFSMAQYQQQKLLFGNSTIGMIQQQHHSPLKIGQNQQPLPILATVTSNPSSSSPSPTHSNLHSPTVRSIIQQQQQLNFPPSPTNQYQQQQLRYSNDMQPQHQQQQTAFPIQPLGSVVDHHHSHHLPLHYGGSPISSSNSSSILSAPPPPPVSNPSSNIVTPLHSHPVPYLTMNYTQPTSDSSANTSLLPNSSTTTAATTAILSMPNHTNTSPPTGIATYSNMSPDAIARSLVGYPQQTGSTTSSPTPGIFNQQQQQQQHQQLQQQQLPQQQQHQMSGYSSNPYFFPQSLLSSSAPTVGTPNPNSPILAHHPLSMFNPHSSSSSASASPSPADPITPNNVNGNITNPHQQLATGSSSSLPFNGHPGMMLFNPSIMNMNMTLPMPFNMNNTSSVSSLPSWPTLGMPQQSNQQQQQQQHKFPGMMYPSVPSLPQSPSMAYTGLGAYSQSPPPPNTANSNTNVSNNNSTATSSPLTAASFPTQAFYSNSFNPSSVDLLNRGRSPVLDNQSSSISNLFDMATMANNMSLFSNNFAAMQNAAAAAAAAAAISSANFKQKGPSSRATHQSNNAIAIDQYQQMDEYSRKAAAGTGNSWFGQNNHRHPAAASLVDGSNAANLNVGALSSTNGHITRNSAPSPSAIAIGVVPPSLSSVISSSSTSGRRKANKLYACTHEGCNETLKTRFSLKRHMKKHTGEKPHTCPYSGCMKSFPEASTLKRHVRIHTGEKPFKCKFPSCNKAFADATNVKRHEMTHTGEKPYKCLVQDCLRTFSRGSSLKQHMITLHKLTQDNPLLTQAVKRGQEIKQEQLNNSNTNNPHYNNNQQTQQIGAKANALKLEQQDDEELNEDDEAEEEEEEQEEDNQSNHHDRDSPEEEEEDESINTAEKQQQQIPQEQDQHHDPHSNAANHSLKQQAISQTS